MSTKTQTAMEDVHKVGGRTELVHGEVVAMPSAGDDLIGKRYRTYIRA